ncbi:MAG: carboxypeptidase regulatory-like domain-containing protein [Bryobacteraceae bacterium]|nr:carboxypeptidase regulatory-like domain-containing protein [Bryobacteraceae bacterium]
MRFLRFPDRAALFVLACLVGVCCASGASIEGTVVENSAGKPIARTRVTLEGTGSTSGGATVLSSSSGQFAFRSLSAGTYLLRAERAGFAVTRYGQRRWNAPGTPIVLDAETQHIVQIRLRKLGAVTGEIGDENQLGLPGVTVHAYRAASKLTLAGSGVTDDRGIYRISNLEPGKYLIRSAARLLEDQQGLLPTFFGQTASAGEARPVIVQLEQDTTGVNIQPLPGRLASLQGTVASPAAVFISLYGDTGVLRTQVPPGGEFHFDQLAPGPYSLLAQAGDRSAPLSSFQKIWIGGESQRVTVELAPSPRLILRCENRNGNPLQHKAISIFLRRRDLKDTTADRAVCGDVLPLTPGTWEVAASAPPDIYVSGLRGARISPFAHEFDMVSGRNTEVVILFSSDPGSLRGTVSTRDGAPAIGAPVYFNPADSDLRSRLGGLRTTRTDASGKFWLNGFPPGRYEVLSTFSPVDGESEDWKPGRGKLVTLGEGGDVTVEIVLEDLE